MTHAGPPPTIVSDVNVPIRRCANEFYPVGTGIPGVSQRDEKTDRNLIVAVSKVLYHAAGSQPAILGYLITTASGKTYYEFGNGLNTSQRAIERTFLRRAGAAATVGVHLDDYIESAGRAFMEIKIPASAYSPDVQLKRCTTLSKTRH